MMIIINLSTCQQFLLWNPSIIVYHLHEENAEYEMDEPFSVKCVTVTDL
jgi:hypothetical protein